MTPSLLRRLLPNASRDEETLAAVSANVSANLLGLGNAATPLGIQAARRMARGCGGVFTGTHRLRIKESDRLSSISRTLAALGIDPEQEFGSVNPETGLAEFRQADGSYAHLLTDTEGNLMATEQAMLALCALERLPDGGCVYESKYREAA